MSIGKANLFRRRCPKKLTTLLPNSSSSSYVKLKPFGKISRDEIIWFDLFFFSTVLMFDQLKLHIDMSRIRSLLFAFSVCYLHKKYICCFSQFYVNASRLFLFFFSLLANVSSKRVCHLDSSDDINHTIHSFSFLRYFFLFLILCCLEIILLNFFSSVS